MRSLASWRAPWQRRPARRARWPGARRAAGWRERGSWPHSVADASRCGPAGLRSCPALPGPQLALARGAPSVASEATPRGDDPMAGHEHGGAVRGACRGHGPRGRRPAEPAGDLAVGPRLAVGDLAERTPHPELEFGAFEIERRARRDRAPLEAACERLRPAGEPTVRRARALDPGLGELPAQRRLEVAPALAGPPGPDAGR